MELKPGSVWYSAASQAQVIVVRAPRGPVELTCGGRPMVAQAPPALEPLETADGGGLLIGKRYVDTETGLELLCTKAGPGSVACDGRVLLMARATPLPSSD